MPVSVLYTPCPPAHQEARGEADGDRHTLQLATTPNEVEPNIIWEQMQRALIGLHPSSQRGCCERQGRGLLSWELEWGCKTG